MLTKNDLILLLTDIESHGENIKDEMNILLRAENIPQSILKFINERRQFDVADFYTMLRKNYNHKKSPLYKNIVKEEFSDPNEALTTLCALNLQIMLFAKNLADSKMFLKHSRGDEITAALNNYYKTYDLIPCLKLIRIIKADIKAFETIIRS